MITLQVEKMKCGGCAANVKQTVLAQDANAIVEVSLELKQVTVETTLSSQSLASLISQAGYPASVKS